MTELGDQTEYVACYPSTSQYEHWQSEAEEMGYNSVSRFIIEMVEAGYKQMSGSITYDEDISELREQRNELKRELDASRERITRLEERLYRGERRTITQFLREQKSRATFDEIVQHVIDDTPARVAEILDEMESNQIKSVDNHYRLRESDTDV